jgi:hypothetical protein
MKKIPIEFNNHAFENAQKRFEQKTNIQKGIGVELKKLLHTDPEGNGFDFGDAVNQFYALLEQQKKEVNTLNVSGEKLADLLGMNVRPLEELQNQFLKVKDAEKPQVENFTTYAETETEIQRFNDCIEAIKGINKIAPYIAELKGSFLQYPFLQSFNPLLVWNNETLKFNPNPAFVKNQL